MVVLFDHYSLWQFQRYSKYHSGDHLLPFAKFYFLVSTASAFSFLLLIITFIFIQMENDLLVLSLIIYSLVSEIFSKLSTLQLLLLWSSMIKFHQTKPNQDSNTEYFEFKLFFPRLHWGSCLQVLWSTESSTKWS